MKKRSKKTLKKVAKGKITLEKAYSKLYPLNKKQLARFVSLRIIVPAEKGVTAFLRILFLFPVSLRLLKFIFRTSNRAISASVPVNYKDLFALPLYKGSYIDIRSKDGEIVKIRTI